LEQIADELRVRMDKMPEKIWESPPPPACPPTSTPSEPIFVAEAGHTYTEGACKLWKGLRPLDYDCAYCAADIEDPCEGTIGKSFHADRWQAAWIGAQEAREALAKRPAPGASPGGPPAVAADGWIVFIINGEDVVVNTVPGAPLEQAQKLALIKSCNHRRPFEDWMIRDERGALLDPEEPQSRWHKARLFLTLKVGGGGSGVPQGQGASNPLSYPCPKCGVPSGAECVSMQGESDYTLIAHKERFAVMPPGDLHKGPMPALGWPPAPAPSGNLREWLMMASKVVREWFIPGVDHGRLAKQVDELSDTWLRSRGARGGR
jgi:hypothetical protein